jgi:dihydroceramidase
MFRSYSLVLFYSSLTANRWHILTAIGGYIGVAIVDLITSGEVTEDPIDSFAWPIPFAARLVTGPTKSAKKA